MSIKTTHRDAGATASTQVQLSEFVNVSVEAEKDPDETPEIDPTVDLSIEVGVGEGKGHYHLMWVLDSGEVISACPHHDLSVITLGEAAEQGSEPCKVCNPTDWRLDEDATEGGA